MSSSDDLSEEESFETKLRNEIKKHKVEIKKLKHLIEEKDELLDEKEAEIFKLKKSSKSYKESSFNDDGEQKDKTYGLQSKNDKEIENSLSKQIVDMSREIELRDEEIKKLSYKVNAFEREISDLRKGDLKTKMTELQGENEMLLGEIEENKKKENVLSKQIADMSKEIELRDEEIKKLSYKVNGLESEVSGMRNQVQKEKCDIQHISKTSGDNKSLENKIKRLEEELESKDKLWKKASKQNENLKDDIKELEHQVKALNDDLKRSKKKGSHDVKESKSGDSFSSENEVDSEKAFREINRLAGTKIRTIADCVKMLKEKSKPGIHSRLSSNESDNDVIGTRKLKKRLTEQDEEIENLNNQITEMTAKYKDKEKQQKKKLKFKDEKIEELQEEIESSSSIKSPGDKKKIKSLEQEIEDLKEDIESKEDDLKKKIKKFKETEIELSDLKSDISEITEQNSIKIREIKQLKEKNDSLEENQINLINENDKLKKNITKLSENLDQSKKEIEELQKSFNDSKLLGERKQSALDTMKDKINQGKKKENNLTNDVNNLIVERDEIQKALHASEEKYAFLTKLYNDHKAKIDDLENKVLNQEAELRKFKKGTMDINRSLRIENNQQRDQVNDQARPHWWQNHREDNDEKACPNCSVLFKNEELRQHLKDCLH